MNSFAPVLAPLSSQDEPSRPRVLLVEDNDDVRGLICELLSEEGLAVVACDGAETAEKEFNKGAFDLVLTDISLPSMSGTDLARRLLERRADQWVVFCSGYVMEIDPKTWGPRVRALLKPFEVDELRALLQEVRGEAP